MVYTLNNTFLDKLRLSEPHIYLRDLRKMGAGLTRPELSKLIGISEHSIRRYESKWQNSNPPTWYELLLRLISGDLSFFGDSWSHCRIHPKTRQISTPYDKYKAYTPKELNMNYNRINRLNENELKQLRLELHALKIELDAAKGLNATLNQRIELLEYENTRLKNKNYAIKKGKVIELFKS